MIEVGQTVAATTEPCDDVIRQVARVVRDASSILFVTGAGVSADSGLPTYRGVGGLYDGEGTEDGIRIELAKMKDGGSDRLVRVIVE